MLRPLFLVLLLAGSLGSFRGLGDDVALVGVGEAWRILPGLTEPPANWREPDFDDASWRTGDSGFGVNQYGENTLLDDLVRGTGTVYFRRAFAVTDPATVRSLTLRCDWQGGFVAYLNGREIARRNLPGPPGTPVPFDAPASSRYAGAAEEIAVPEAIPALRPGTNVLAIQVHPMLVFGRDVVLVPELLANFTRGPYLQSVLTDRATVLWRTPQAQAGRVEFGPTPALGRSVAAAGVTNVQEVTLGSLEPGVRYYYRVVAGDGPSAAVSPTYSFRTLPAAGNLDFVVWGDSGSGHAAQFAVARQLALRSPDLMVHLGDVIYPSFTLGQTDARCLSVYRGLLRTTPAYFTWGNHDLYAGVEPFTAAFRQPTNNVSAADHAADGTRPEFYYSFDAGDAHFAVLFAPYTSQYYMREDSPQLRWLEADLAASAKPWKFLCLHLPVNTSGGHRFDDYNRNGIPDRMDIAARLLPVAARYGVQMIFSGHDHNFERFHPVNGTHLVVTGGGGIYLYGMVERDPNSAVFQARWHYSAVQLRGDTLRLTAVDSLGQAFDALEFRRTSRVSADSDGDGLGDAAETALGTRADNPDTDGDGLPDGWEYLRGLDPRRPAEADHERLLAEFLGGGLPRPLTELTARRRPEGGLQLRWLGAVGFRAVIEAAAHPGDPWEPLAGSPAGLSLGEDLQTRDLPADAATRFFRVRLVAE